MADTFIEADAFTVADAGDVPGCIPLDLHELSTAMGDNCWPTHGFPPQIKSLSPPSEGLLRHHSCKPVYKVYTLPRWDLPLTVAHLLGGEF